MSDVRLFINDFQVDLYEGEKIGYTKQANSLDNLASRQTNFSKSFKLKNTAKNIKNFEGLGIDGSTSNYPYQKNTAMLFVENICLIVKGWGIFKDSNEDFNFHIYDGNIDFFKNLDNVKFEDINLDEISHTKDVESIKESWENPNQYYRYLVADFNGNTFFEYNTDQYINIDYLVPSVKTEFLWERIFETFGFTFSGTTFNTEQFKNLFLTYPKGVTSGADGDTYAAISYASDDMPYSFQSRFYPMIHDENVGNNIDITNNISQGNLLPFSWASNSLYYSIPEDGFYRIRITGTMTLDGVLLSLGLFAMGINQHQAEPVGLGGMSYVLSGNGNGTYNIDFDQPFDMEQGDTVSLFYYRQQALGQSSDHSGINYELEIIKIEQTTINQIEFFKGLTPKDFYREIMWRFGLTPFPSKDKNHLDFLTYDERINGEIEDWSDKYERTVSESYSYNSYAKQNFFRFKYSGEGDQFNDGYLVVENENLEDNTDIIKSKTYSPERYPVPFVLSLHIPQIKLWEKEVKTENDETVIEYKSLDARFSFLREKQLSNLTVRLGSEQLSEFDTSNKISLAENYDYSWDKIIDDSYTPIKSLFKKTLITKVIFNLSIYEFDAFDMKKRIYVKQKGGEFIVNKLTKRDLNKLETEAELIKINR
ncbi:hypothetical protein [Mesonia sp. K4-1]|uniref:hypothetical protein n=1 Tax=Mesonia sp. K4-1 TaxID=2602760 RepID=UPI0011C79726|nr:hypothetical protein [Mesonia sp. K4-1]TXK78696.1 hypothetical protein FT986_02565 [Mesonia sp. K4-1]